MTAVDSLSPVIIRSVIDAFATITWPAPTAELIRVASRLGWTVGRERRGGVTLETGYPMNYPRARALYNDGNVGQVNVYLTDAIDEPDAVQAGELRALSDAFREEVTSYLGQPVHVRTGKDARYAWDLVNRGRVAVADIGSAVQLIVLQESYADVERGEERLGISPDRDPEADLS